MDFFYDEFHHLKNHLIAARLGKGHMKIKVVF